MKSAIIVLTLVFTTSQTLGWFSRSNSRDSTGGHHSSGGKGASGTQSCVKQCLGPFRHAIESKDNTRICQAYSSFKPCVQNCPMGDQLWQQSMGKDPKAFRGLEKACTLTRHSGRASGQSDSGFNRDYDGRNSGSRLSGGSRSPSPSRGASRGWGNVDSNTGGWN